MELPTKPNSEQSEDGKPRVQEETSNWFLTSGLKLKVIFSGFATANPLDSRVAEARGILLTRGLHLPRVFRLMVLEFRSVKEEKR